MKFKTIFNIVVFVAVITLTSGCELVPYHQIVPIKGYLETPEGKYDFKTISEQEAINYKLKRGKDISYSYLMADGKDTKVFFSLSITRPLIVMSTKKQSNIEIIAADSYFQIADEEPKPVVHIDGINKNQLGKHLYSNKDSIDFWYGTMNLLRPEEVFTSKKSYRYHIIFKLNSAPYLADFSFKYKEKKKIKWLFGVPAMP